MDRTNIPIDKTLHAELKQLRKDSGGVPISVLAEYALRHGMIRAKAHFLPAECRGMAQCDERICERAETP